MNLSTSIHNYFEAKRAEQLSEKTLRDYESTLARFAAIIGEHRDINEITVHDVRSFLASLSVSKKRVKNIHITLSSFWTWAVRDGVCDEHIMRRIPAPKPEIKPIVPFQKHEIEAMLDAVEYSLPYTRPGKRSCHHHLSNTLRDRAIIIFLLDTGVRASELCKIRMSDFGHDSVYVRGKGAKDRIVPMSSITYQTVKLYLAEQNRKPSSFVFLTKAGKPMTPDSLRGMIKRTAERAGVPNAYPHRFRHTFAINFLRNGGDVFSLQRILGHSTLDMVKRYVAIANSDIQTAHRRASPVVVWELTSNSHKEEVS